MNTLATIQQKLKAPKSQRNSFGNYNYRNLEDILEALKPLLGEATLTIADEIVQIGDRFYVKATATLTDGDQAWTNTAYARETEQKKGMDESQITGATSSYARKYCLNGLFCIDDTKDADSQDNTKTPVPAKSVPQVPNLNASDVCADCGSPKVMRKDGSGTYCKNKYPLTNPSCPKKKPTTDEQRIMDELDDIPVIQ